MSIINDALKQAQEKLKNTQSTKKDAPAQTPASPGPMPLNEPLRKTGQKPLLKRIVTFLLVSLLYFCIFSLIFLAIREPQRLQIPALKQFFEQTFMRNEQSASQADQTSAQNKAPLPSSQNPPAPENIPNVKVSGIMVMDNGSRVALIDDNVYEMGNKVKGFLIEDITLKEVLLLKDNIRFKVPVKN